MGIQFKTCMLKSILIFLLLTYSGTVFAAEKKGNPSEAKSGLKTNYSKISISNLPIGKTVSMTEIANAPLIVGNNYEVPIFVEIRTESPANPKDGYSVIPDPAWIIIEPSGATVGAMGSNQFDVKVSIPNDEKIYGNKYVCSIVIYTQGDPSMKTLRFGTQITGFFMFSIAPGSNDEGLNAALKNPADAAYSINPPVIVMKDVKPGEKIKLRTEEKKKIELQNNSNKTQQYWIHSVDPGETKYKLLSKSRFAGSVEDVILGQDKIKLGSGKKKSLDISVQVPSDADMSLESLAYLVSITSGTSEGVVRYLAIYLNGEKTIAEIQIDENKTNSDPIKMVPESKSDETSTE